MELIRSFKKLGKNDVALAGGKGASLGEMTQAGISVPPGFVILANAFEKFLEETDLNVEIDATLNSVNYKEIHTIENAAEKIKALILQAEMPQDIANEIQKFFKNLNTEFVAVRSSATAEDSSSAAWAGQLESYLNTKKSNLLENVKKCWASLFTPRAIFYRFEKKLCKQKISVAVVVQKMIKSEVSGVAFSVHPITQDKNQLIIEAGFGLGEAIVSGQITPDSYVIKKEPMQIIDKNIQTQLRGFYRAENGGNEWQNIPKEKGEKQVLSDKDILELSKIILQIENHYDFPCDIEWAFEKGKFYIVQSRPITTLQKRTELRPLAKIITREAPLVGVESWYEGIVNETEKFFNIKFPENLFVFRRGTVESWRDSVQLKITPLELSRWVKKNKDRLAEGYNRQKATLKLIATIKNKMADSEHEILENLTKIRNSFSYGFPGVVVVYLMPLWQEIYVANENKLFDGEIIKQCVEWRRETDPFFDQSIEIIYYLLTRLCKIKKWDIEIVKYISYQELISAIKTGLNEEELIRRRKSIFAYIDGQLIFESNFDIELAKKNLFLPKEIIPGSKDIKGSSANTGFASGRVKVVFAKEELSKVDEGDILVAPMTTPWYMPAMEKAAAFVTDEGGITCHAAIIAREMKKPCIIGTKIATQVLKDGDLVEVDANSGVIKILKNQSFSNISINNQDVFDYIKNQEWFFGIKRSNDSLLLYSAKCNSRVTRLIQKEYGIEFAERLLFPFKNNYFIRAINSRQAKNFHAASNKKILKNPRLLIDYLGKDYLLNHDIEEYEKRLMQAIEENNYQEGVRFFKKIFNLYEMISVLFIIIFSLGLKLTENKDNLKNIGDIIKKHNAWKNNFPFREDALIEKVSYFFKFLVKRKKIKVAPLFLMKLLTLDELQLWLNEKLTDVEIKNIITSRKNNGFIYLNLKDKSREIIDSIAEVKKIQTYFLKLDKEFKKSKNKNEIIGQVAYNSGKSVSGKVIIIKDKSKLKSRSHMISGNILVAVQTTPHFIPYMKKAKAIITDEGGITCHAAIIAREMKKPCIIGTKIATQVLKDGDLVEVDANNGVIKIKSK